MIAQTKRILLVEDDENDVFFMKLALSKAKLDPPIHVSDNGQDAIDYLAGTGPYADRHSYPLPACVFLDIKLPFVHGFEVLEWIRGEATLVHVEVYILTSSPEDRDRQRAARLGAKAYLLKPPTPHVLLEILKARVVEPDVQPRPAPNGPNRRF